MIKTEQCEPTLNTTWLFVYGTLRPGQANFSSIEKLVVAHQPATIEGELIDLGAFPALVPGHGIVVGDLLTLQPEALEITDRIEGYQPEHPSNLYDRREVVVTLTDGTIERAWTYFFAHPERLTGHPKALVGQRDGRRLFTWPINAGDSLPKSQQIESKS